MVSLKMERGNGAGFCMGPRFVNIDHDTLCAFRRNNLALINESFVRVVEMAAELKIRKVGQITVAIDATKVMAYESKHSAVSYQRSGELIQQLEWTLVSTAYNLKRLHRMVGTA